MVNKIPSPQSVVVPVEPTEAMLRRGAQEYAMTRQRPCQTGEDDVRDVWSAIIGTGRYSYVVDADISPAAPAPSSLAGGEWVREDYGNSTLLYTLKQQGWRKGEPVMVNDKTVRVEFDGDREPVIAAILAALSPEAPARDRAGDVPRDERGRTAFEIIADCNRESMMRRAGVKDQSREPLLGPPSDMAVSRVLLAERPEIDRNAADLLAIKINDALSALTPRHEAPAEGAGEDFRAQVVKELDHLIAHVVAIGPDKPDLNTPMARRVWREVAADAILALRARSSAPEAREGEAWRATCESLIDIVEGIGGIQHGTWRDEKGVRLKDTPAWAEFYVAARTAAPSADKLRIAVEALEKARAWFTHCAEMIDSSFNISGTLLAERTIKAKHYALEADQALAALRAEGA